jgi:hypothetical protein
MLQPHLRLLVFVSAVTLCSCDVDLFGSDTKKIGRNCRLVKVDWPGEFVFSAPPDQRPEAVTELGWEKPLVVVRLRDAKEWRVFDTSTGQWTTISDEQRRADPRYAAIPIYAAGDAWSLPRRQRRW